MVRSFQLTGCGFSLLITSRMGAEGIMEKSSTALDLLTITNTAHGLHRGAALLDAVQRLTQPPQPAYLELGLQVLPRGLSTGARPAGGRVMLDLSGGCLISVPSDGRSISLPIVGRSQSD